MVQSAVCAALCREDVASALRPGRSCLVIEDLDVRLEVGVTMELVDDEPSELADDHSRDHADRLGRPSRLAERRCHDEDQRHGDAPHHLMCHGDDEEPTRSECVDLYVENALEKLKAYVFKLQQHVKPTARLT